MEKVKEIKRTLRTLMNGVTAQSMREKGLDYHVNWGASLLHLRELANEYEKDGQLAMALWQDDVRECKILATMLMPVEEMQRETALQWIGQTHTQEIAEIASKNLYQYLPYATDMALDLLGKDDRISRLHGFCIMAGTVSSDKTLTEAEAKAFLDSVVVVLAGEDLVLKHAALNAVQRYADVDAMCHEMAKCALKTIKMDDWL